MPNQWFTRKEESQVFFCLQLEWNVLHNILKVWNACGYGSTPSRPPARMRHGQQACFHPFCSCHQLIVILPIGNGRSISWQHGVSPQCSIKASKKDPPSWSSEKIQLPPQLLSAEPNSPPTLGAKTLPLLQYPCSCRQRCAILIFCWQDGGKVVYVISIPWAPGLVGESKTALLRVSQSHWNNAPRDVRRWGWHCCPLAHSGVRQAWGVPLWGQTSISWLVKQVCRVEEGFGVFFLVLFVCCLIFLALEINSKENIPQDLYLLCKNGLRLLSCQRNKKTPPLICFDGVS